VRATIHENAARADIFQLHRPYRNPNCGRGAGAGLLVDVPLLPLSPRAPPPEFPSESERAKSSFPVR